jgi:hypothetical protein
VKQKRNSFHLEAKQMLFLPNSRFQMRNEKETTGNDPKKQSETKQNEKAKRNISFLLKIKFHYFFLALEMF